MVERFCGGRRSRLSPRRLRPRRPRPRRGPRLRCRCLGLGARLRPRCFRRLGARRRGLGLGAACLGDRLGLGGPQPASGSAGGLGLGDGLGRGAALLVEQGREAVGEVAGKGLEEAGELLERGGDGPGHLGQEHVARGQVGQGGEVLGRQEAVAVQATLDDQVRVWSGRSRAGPWPPRSPRPRRRRWRWGPPEAGRQRLMATAADRQLDQGVLVDLVVAAGGPERAAQGGELGDGQAPVLGEDGGVGARRGAHAPRSRRPPSLAWGSPSIDSRARNGAAPLISCRHRIHRAGPTRPPECHDRHLVRRAREPLRRPRA